MIIILGIVKEESMKLELVTPPGFGRVPTLS
jgi:hypothetical protein